LTPHNALDIADEMRDRERRKLNMVVYSFSEKSERKADIQAFQALNSEVFKLVSITKAIRFGPKVANKDRPLLLTVEDMDDKSYLISHSHFLRCHEQYSKVFIAQDRMKLNVSNIRKQLMS